jgi:hypothetical protein
VSTSIIAAGCISSRGTHDFSEDFWIAFSGHPSEAEIGSNKCTTNNKYEGAGSLATSDPDLFQRMP